MSLFIPDLDDSVVVRGGVRPDGLPRPIPLGQVRPRRPGPQPPQHTIDHLPVITPRPTTPIHLRQQGLYPLPCRLRQLTSTCHKIN